MRYLDLIEKDYKETLQAEEGKSKLEYIGEDVFNLCTYCVETTEFMTTKALEVCHAINNRNNHEYISVDHDHTWYVTILNMPFFKDKIDWGTSIRGAWWCKHESMNNNNLKLEDMDNDKWHQFISDLLEFSGLEIDSKNSRAVIE